MSWPHPSGGVVDARLSAGEGPSGPRRDAASGLRQFVNESQAVRAAQAPIRH